MNYAYLLRCWLEGKDGPAGKPKWRFSLEEVNHDRCRIGFTSLEAMVAFMEAELVNRREGTIGKLEETKDKNPRAG